MDFQFKQEDAESKLSLKPSHAPTSGFETASKFPVVAVTVSISVFVLSLLLLVFICTVRKRRKELKYQQYSQVAKEAIDSELNVKQRQHTDQQITPRNQDTLSLPHKMSASEESLSPLSSDDTYYDAMDKVESGRRSRSISSREVSPSRADEKEDAADEDWPDGHIGRLWFSAQYEYNAENLKVILHKAKNLPNRSGSVATCDPLVKVSLLPNGKHVAQSRYKPKNKNPVYNETFLINIPSHHLEQTTLCLTVVDGYRANKQTTIGEVHFPLKALHESEISEVHRDLTKAVEDSCDLGHIHISLSYYPTLHRLTIIILRATNLKKLSRYSDPFVKVSFSIGNKIMKSKKTAVHKDSTSPMFNDAFNFTVSEDDLSTSTILVSVIQSGGGVVEDKQIGRVLLGGRMYSRGKECDHWIEMMTSPRKMIKRWHELHT